MSNPKQSTPPPARTGPRVLNRDERRVLADALRRAASDTRTTLHAWQTNIPKALGDDERAANNRRWLEALAAVQDRLAAEIADTGFELTLAKREPS